MSDQQTGRGNTVSNAFYQAEGIVKLRLDTKPLLDDIELFLRGQVIEVIRDKVGRPKTQRAKVGKAKANDQGVQDIMTKVTSIINPSVVQGNFDIARFEEYIFECRMELSEMLFVNRMEYQIDVKDYNIVIDFIMKLVEPYVSRLVDNLERESYSQTIRTVESATLEKRKGIMPF